MITTMMSPTLKKTLDTKLDVSSLETFKKQLMTEINALLAGANLGRLTVRSKSPHGHSRNGSLTRSHAVLERSLSPLNGTTKQSQVSQRSVTDSKALKALENRLKLKLAAIDDKFAKELGKTNGKIEAVRAAITNHVLVTPASTVSRGRVAGSGPKAYHSQSVLGKKRSSSVLSGSRRKSSTLKKKTAKVANQAPSVPQDLNLHNQHTFNSQKGSGSYRSVSALSYRRSNQLSPQP